MFAVQLVLTFIAVQWTIRVGAMNVEDLVHPGINPPKDEMNADANNSFTENDETKDELSAEWINELLNSTDEFFAGENTPVWTAYRAKLSPRVRYTKLEKNRVKMAIDYWKSPEFKGFPTRARRDIRDKAAEMASSVIEEATRLKRDYRDDDGIETLNKGASNYPIKVVHPSVLVMMDYVEEWPVDKMEQEKLISERILYALAFWKGVDLHFRHVLEPKVRLRISGIIIAMSKRATPYIFDHRIENRVNMRNAYRPMLQYWRELPKRENIFPLEGYHVVATMTNATPWNLSPDPAYAIASLGPACDGFGANVAGLIFPDDLAFGGLNVAVHETAHTLGVKIHDGGSDDCPALKGHVMMESSTLSGRNFSECALGQIWKRIKFQGECVEHPREFQPAGKPIKHILPGKLTPASKQCEARGWEDGIVCWDRMTCEQLYCRNNHWWSWCGDGGTPVDGTTCKPGKICLDGKCVRLPQANTTSPLKTPREDLLESQDRNLHGDPLSIIPISRQADQTSGPVFKNSTPPS